MSRVAYVSAAFDDWELARLCQQVLADRGYVVEDDWTQDAEVAGSTQAEHKNEMPDSFQRDIAEEHVEAAKNCDLHVLVFGPSGHKMGGGWIEFGIAWFCGATPHVIAPPRNSVFFHLPGVRVFESLEVWRDFIYSFEAGALIP